MTTLAPVADYTRVSDDAAILCRRKDFPRAINVLQRRDPDRRRWRMAFRTVAVTADRALDGARRNWFEGAIREVVTGLEDKRLRSELVIDAATCDASLVFPDVLPSWNGRELWRLAESVHLPMEYLVRVTKLPRSLSEQIHTARVVVDCRRTADAHRAAALELDAALPPDAFLAEAKGQASVATCATLAAVRAQQDAARRWRELALRLTGM